MEKKSTPLPQTPNSKRHWLLFSGTLALLTPLLGALIYIVNVTNEFLVYDAAPVELLPQAPSGPLPFPVGVNPDEKQIAELPNIETYRENELGEPSPTEENTEVSVRTTLLRKVVARLALFEWYQSLAAGASRVLVIQPGERKEQIASNFGKILKWDEDMKREFLVSVVSNEPVLLEGKFAPGTYLVARDATPRDVAPLIITRFNDEVLARYKPAVSEKVALHDALTIASILEREAYDFEDMRHIAGVIWNRLFIDMNLQIDATLQYAKGTQSKQSWWPKPVPDDKYIDSPYNTYQNSGLTPTPIANPSVDAIVAALNPRETTCMYYFHDSDGGFHCAPTYEEHVRLLKQYYGRGK
jgi:cell division protein YceG involved in septum cleavage